MLYIVQNNRAYHQEHMYLTAMAARRSRGIEKAHIGTTLTDPTSILPRWRRALEYTARVLLPIRTMAFFAPGGRIFME